jgi:hypothetical protein
MTYIKSLRIYKSVTNLALQQLWKQPKLMTPFFYFALINFAGLVIIYYSPQWPFNLVLGPPIRAFYNESALHYPYNLAYLPQIYHGWRMFTEIVFASILAGITISMYAQHSKNMSLRFSKNYKIAFNRYFALVLFSFLIIIPPYILNRFLVYFIAEKLYIHNRVMWMLALGGINFLANLALLITFVYVPVAIIVENLSFWQSCQESVRKTGKYFTVTFLIILVPTLISTLIEAISLAIPKLMDILQPEISLVIVSLGILAAFMVNVIVAVSSTILYLNVKDLVARKEPDYD